MDWELLIDIGYILLIIVICLHIVYNTPSNDKALAYVLLTIFLPLVGIAIYFAFGTNRRKNKLYSKKIVRNKATLSDLRERITLESEKALDTQELAI